MGVKIELPELEEGEHEMSRYIRVVRECDLDKLKAIGFNLDKGRCRYEFPISNKESLFEKSILISGDYVFMLCLGFNRGDSDNNILWSWDHAGCISIEELESLVNLIKKGNTK